MPSVDVHGSLNVRTLLLTTRTPFSAAVHAPGAVLCSQGDPSDSVMYIESGQVRLVVTTRGGQEGVCGVLRTGAFIGDVGITAGHATRRHTVVAMTRTEVLVVMNAPMSRLLHAEPAVAEVLLAHVLTRHGRLESDLADQLLHSSEERLARALLLLADCDASHGCSCALPAVSQTVLAEIVGTTRSRVNRLIGKFRKLGFIESEGDVLRVNSARLQGTATRQKEGAV